MEAADPVSRGPRTDTAADEGEPSREAQVAAIYVDGSDQQGRIRAEYRYRVLS